MNKGALALRFYILWTMLVGVVCLVVGFGLGKAL